MWSPPDATAPPPAACAAAIRRVDGTASAASVPAGCWRVGPLVIGMTPAEVTARIGPPDQRFSFTSDDVDRRRYAAAVYLFPRGLDARLRRRPAMALPPLRLIGLLYAQGRLARIDVGLGYGMASGRCPDGRPAPPASTAGPNIPSSDVRPFARFATVRLGEPIARAAHRLGRDYTISTARDFRAFHPAPITLGGDDRLASFSVSADEDAEFEGFTPRLTLRRRTGDCRIDGLAFEPSPAS